AILRVQSGLHALIRIIHRLIGDGNTPASSEGGGSGLKHPVKRGLSRRFQPFAFIIIGGALDGGFQCSEYFVTRLDLEPQAAQCRPEAFLIVYGFGFVTPEQRRCPANSVVFYRVSGDRQHRVRAVFVADIADSRLPGIPAERWPFGGRPVMQGVVACQRQMSSSAAYCPIACNSGSSMWVRSSSSTM